MGADFIQITMASLKDIPRPVEGLGHKSSVQWALYNKGPVFWCLYGWGRRHYLSLLHCQPVLSLWPAGEAWLSYSGLADSAVHCNGNVWEDWVQNRYQRTNWVSRGSILLRMHFSTSLYFSECTFLWIILYPLLRVKVRDSQNTPWSS